jgi:hypothetical protein
MHKKLFANLLGMTSLKPNHKPIHKKSFPHQQNFSNKSYKTLPVTL